MKYLKEKIEFNIRKAREKYEKELAEKQRLEQERAYKEAEEFNVFKTWTEYINRLIGAIVGFSLIFIFMM